MKKENLILSDKSVATFAAWCAAQGFIEDLQQSDTLYSACNRRGDIAERRVLENGEITEVLITYGATPSTKQVIEDQIAQLDQAILWKKQADTLARSLVQRAAKLYYQQTGETTINFDEEDGVGCPTTFGLLMAEKPIQSAHFDNEGLLQGITVEDKLIPFPMCWDRDQGDRIVDFYALADCILYQLATR